MKPDEGGVWWRESIIGIVTAGYTIEAVKQPQDPNSNSCSSRRRDEVKSNAIM